MTIHALALPPAPAALTLRYSTLPAQRAQAGQRSLRAMLLDGPRVHRIGPLRDIAAWLASQGYSFQPSARAFTQKATP